jgi:hypothetical protein
MAKYLIYIVNISDSNAKIDHTDYSLYCIETWKYWCKKNKVDLKVITENDDRCGRPIWNKELVYEHSYGYSKIGVVDADTMIRWDTPNIFETFNDDFCMVRDTVNWSWVYKSIQNYGKFFKGVHLDISNYGNAGVLFFHAMYIPMFEQIFKFYKDNQEELDNWNKGGGREQTILNFFLAKNNVNVKYLDGRWNVLGMHKRGWLNSNSQLQTDTPHLVKYSNIWHFTGFPIESRTEVVKYIWNIVKGKYSTNS